MPLWSDLRRWLFPAAQRAAAAPSRARRQLGLEALEVRANPAGAAPLAVPLMDAPGSVAAETAPEREAMSEPLSVALVSERPATASVDGPVIVSVPAGTDLAQASIVVSAQLTALLDDLPAQLAASVPSSHDTAQSAVCSVSVGAVAWAIRGVSLAGVLFAASSGWQTIDPLVLLENNRRRKRGQSGNDDESLRAIARSLPRGTSSNNNSSLGAT
jgi:hypothetical protein